MAAVAATAAAAAAVHPSPPPLARRTVAWLVCTRLAWATIDAAFCLFLASMWLFFWGLATNVIGRLACGEGCAVVTAAKKVMYVAVWVITVLVFLFLGRLMVARGRAQDTAAAATAPDTEATKELTALMMARAQTAAAATATDTEARKEPAPETSSYAAVRDMLCDSLILGFLALLAFTLLMLIGDLVKGDSPVMGSRRSRREKMGSAIYDVGALGMVMVNCFVSCPIITVRFWRARAWMKSPYAL